MIESLQLLITSLLSIIVMLSGLVVGLSLLSLQRNREFEYLCKVEVFHSGMASEVVPEIKTNDLRQEKLSCPSQERAAILSSYLEPWQVLGNSEALPLSLRRAAILARYLPKEVMILPKEVMIQHLS